MKSVEFELTATDPYKVRYSATLTLAPECIYVLPGLRYAHPHSFCLSFALFSFLCSLLSLSLI